MDFGFIKITQKLVINLLRWVIALHPLQQAVAARPFVTDDARLTSAQSCQLESWTRSYRHSTEVWALPACNPWGNLELTLGVGHALYDTYSTSDYVFQAKTLFRELTAGGVGWGLAAGRVLHPGIAPGPNLLGNQYFYLPISYATPDGRQVIHLNLGVLRDRARDKNLAAMGLGLELNQTDRLQWIAESFGEQNALPFFQAGLRYAVIRNLLQVDATLGGQAGGSVSTRWFSLGLRFTPERVLKR
ncbi:MAG: hypothetical protein FGM18_05770 [Burkholderiaceae bacterium]|nr:hypothetical protein [Burkholderiaceae bacterium]